MLDLVNQSGPGGGRRGKRDVLAIASRLTDAMQFCWRGSRAGELTSVWVPDQTHEAMRDLIRGREVVAR